MVVGTSWLSETFPEDHYLQYRIRTVLAHMVSKGEIRISYSIFSMAKKKAREDHQKYLGEGL